MNVIRVTRRCTLAASVAVGTTIGLTQHIAAQQLQPPQQPQRPKARAAVQDGVEVLTRGPVHEAFAETITFDPEPGIVAPQAPPADIEEVPPQQRPGGKNVACRLRFQPVDPTERQQFGQRGQEYRTYLQQRQQSEADAARTPGVDPTIATGPARRRFSRSHFVAPPVEQLGKDYTPPQRHQLLKPNFQVQPQPRIRQGAPGVRQAFRPGAAGGLQQQQQQDAGLSSLRK